MVQSPYSTQVFPGLPCGGENRITGRDSYCECLRFFHQAKAGLDQWPEDDASNFLFRRQLGRFPSLFARHSFLGVPAALSPVCGSRMPIRGGGRLRRAPMRAGTPALPGGYAASTDKEMA